MSKKAVMGTALALAWLGLACLCVPGDLLRLEPVPSAQPTETLVPTLTAGRPTAADIPACVLELDRILEEAQNVTPSGEVLDGEFTLASYVIQGDAITAATFPQVPSQVTTYQQDVAGQQEIWDFVADVIPAEQRTMLSRFVVFTDGVGGTLGAVEPTDSPQYWMLEVDLVDAGYFPDLSATLIHELAHLLTLNDAQVITDTDLFYSPDDEELYRQADERCDTYFVFEGCSLPDSYLNTFFQRFWAGIFDEWFSIDGEPDDQVYEERLDAFYQEYAVQFVSNYAATSPTEDIAESFLYFVFSPKPSGLTVAEQKVLFFYEHPEMVDLRQHILEHLCTYLP